MYTYKFAKYNWALLVTTTAKTHLSPSLINLVQQAYAKTPEGSFVNTAKDVVASNWIAYDWDKDPDADSVMFFRTARASEPWSGYKIQGIGHDTQRTSIDKVMEKIRTQLKKPGWWIEASDAMEHILYKDRSVKVIEDELTLHRLFPNTKLKMLNDSLKKGKYQRMAGPHLIKESVFGLPKIK